MARDCPDGQCVIGAIETQRAILADRTQPIAGAPRRAEVPRPLRRRRAPADARQQPPRQGRQRLPDQPAHEAGTRGLREEELRRRRDGHQPALDLGLLHPRRGGRRQARPSGPGAEGLHRRLDALPWPPESGAISAPKAWAAESCRLVDARSLYPNGHILDRTLPRRDAPARRTARPPGRVAPGEAARRHAGHARARPEESPCAPTSPPSTTPPPARGATWSSDPATRKAAILDPVLDFDAKSGAHARTTRRRRLLDHVAANACRCAGCWKRTRTPITCRRRSGCANACPARASPSAAASGRRSAASRRCSGSATDVPTDGSQFDQLVRSGRHVRDRRPRSRSHRRARPHRRLRRVPDRRCVVLRRHACSCPTPAPRARDFPNARRRHAVSHDPALLRVARRHARLRLPRLRPERPRGRGRNHDRRAEAREHPPARGHDAKPSTSRCARRATPRCRCPR